MQRRETQRTESALGKEIAEKRRLLYERHGGIMSPVDVAREMGYYPKPSSGDRWAQEHDVPAVRLGARKRGYETDLVAKATRTGAVGWYKDAPARGWHTGEGKNR